MMISICESKDHNQSLINLDERVLQHGAKYNFLEFLKQIQVSFAIYNFNLHSITPVTTSVALKYMTAINKTGGYIKAIVQPGLYYGTSYNPEEKNISQLYFTLGNVLCLLGINNIHATGVFWGLGADDNMFYPYNKGIMTSVHSRLYVPNGLPTFGEYFGYLTYFYTGDGDNRLFPLYSHYFIPYINQSIPMFPVAVGFVGNVGPAFMFNRYIQHSQMFGIKIQADIIPAAQLTSNSTLNFILTSLWLFTTNSIQFIKDQPYFTCRYTFVAFDVFIFLYKRQVLENTSNSEQTMDNKLVFIVDTMKLINLFIQNLFIDHVLYFFRVYFFYSFFDSNFVIYLTINMKYMVIQLHFSFTHGLQFFIFIVHSTKPFKNLFTKSNKIQSIQAV